MPKKVIPPTPAENTSPLSRMLEGRPARLGGDIDERMARLREEHVEMGAREAEEPDNGDLFPASQPLNQSITRDQKPKAAPKKK